MFDWKIHWKLYLGMFSGLVLPLTVLIIWAPVPTQSLPFAFVAMTFFVKIMGPRDKVYLEYSRKEANDLLRRTLGKQAPQGEIEVMAHKMVQSRQIAFFVIAGIQLTHLLFVS